MTSDDPQPRSLLFSPGNRPDLMAKAEQSGADALILDLEDSVPDSEKARARREVSERLAVPGSIPLYVRIAHPDAGSIDADLMTLTGSRLRGVLLPKLENLEDLARVDRSLVEVERRLGASAGHLGIVPMIETCLGVHRAFELLSGSSRIRGVALASAEEGDLMADLGGRWTPGGEAMLYPRGRLVCAARACGVGWIIDGVFMNLADAAALQLECELARNMGFTAKLAIHPKQVPIVNAALTPTSAEVDYARGLIEAFRAAESKGIAAIRYRGTMVDYANVKRAELVLRSARFTTG